LRYGPGEMAHPIYKICTQAEWTAAAARGLYEGSAVDARDGFIHFSTAPQVAETAAKHFAGQTDLVLVTVDAGRLPVGALKWEASRGGALFPHLYRPLTMDAVIRIDPLPWVEGEGHRFPEGVADA
jgi:uncharacterized protein (DUF952 family)